jgi:hypothetical protein
MPNCTRQCSVSTPSVRPECRVAHPSFGRAHTHLLDHDGARRVDDVPARLAIGVDAVNSVKQELLLEVRRPENVLLSLVDLRKATSLRKAAEIGRDKARF